jgi:hypothetical protein
MSRRTGALDKKKKDRPLVERCVVRLLESHCQKEKDPDPETDL